MEILYRMYNHPNFGLYLFTVITILAILFVIVLILALKDAKKAKLLENKIEDDKDQNQNDNFVLANSNEGAIYPINPKYAECQGLQCFACVQDLDEIPNLVMVAIPAKAVLQNVKECAEFGVKNFYIISSGFGELGAEGKKIEKEISDFAKENSIPAYCYSKATGMVAPLKYLLGL